MQIISSSSGLEITHLDAAVLATSLSSATVSAPIGIPDSRRRHENRPPQVGLHETIGDDEGVLPRHPAGDEDLLAEGPEGIHPEHALVVSGAHSAARRMATNSVSPASRGLA